MENLNTGAIVVRVEMHDGVTGQISEIARMHIAHVGTTSPHGDYDAATMRSQGKEAFARPQRSALVRHYKRLTHAWHLIARALIAMGYASEAECRELRNRPAPSTQMPATTETSIPPCPVPLVRGART